MSVSTQSFGKPRTNRFVSSLAVGLLAGAVSVSAGCSASPGARLASLNPFGKSSPDASNDGSGWMSGPKKVGSSIAGGAKTAASKSRDTLAGWFGRDNKPPTTIPGDETDPVSLANKAEVTPEVFVANGRLWESTGNYEKAMESYAKALEKSPNDPAALANIARLHFRQNNHAKAAEYFGKAIQQQPNDAGLYNDLGLTLSKLGNHSAATSALSRALTLSPKSSRYANNLASVKFASGDTAGALEVLVQNNKPAVAHFNMAYLHYKHNQRSEATRHLNEALAFGSRAGSDVATQRAVTRAQELLAQIGQFDSGTALATSTQPAGSAAGRNGTTGPVQPASQRHTAGGFSGATAAPGYENLIQPASAAGKANVNFGKASYKQPVGAANETSAANAAAATQPTDSSQGFSLPPVPAQ